MPKTLQKFTTCLWFDSNAKEAMEFYSSIFPNARLGSISYYGAAGHEVHHRPKDSVMTVRLAIDEQEFMGLNGGPIFSLNPSISFYVACKSENEINDLYDKLSDDGSVLMELKSYPFSPRYSWLNDRFGVSWQLILTEKQSQKISPCLMFTGKHKGQAEEAILFYTSIFKNSTVDYLIKYEEGEPAAGIVKHAGFKLDGRQFVAMDSPVDHSFGFTPATSFVVSCKTQAELDEFWDKLLAGGGSPSQCGWLTDRFGVSWQLVPASLEDLLTAGSNNNRRERVLAAIMTMVKFDINELEKAARGSS